LVYCSKCGTNNEEDTKYCINCGASLDPSAPREIRREKRDECFGLPHGGAIAGIIFGIIIILWGLREFFDWRVDFGPFFVIIIGLLIVAGAIYGITRRR
jgi:hypothetical protein